MRQESILKALFGKDAFLIAVVALFTLFIAALSWFFGGVHASAYLLCCIVALLALSVFVIASVRRDRRTPDFPLLGWCLLGAILLGCFQLIPIPLSVLQRVSPERAQTLAEYHDSAAPEVQRAAISQASERTRSDLARLATFMLVFLSGTLLPKRHVRQSVIILAGSGIALALFGIANRLSWNGHIYWVFKSPSYLSFASFVNHNNAGGYLCLVVSLITYLWVLNGFERWKVQQSATRRRNWSPYLLADWRDIWFALSIFILILAIVFTVSRGAFLGLLAGGLAVSIVIARSVGSRTKSSLLILAFGVILFVAWAGSSSAVWGRLSRLDSDELESVRFLHWQADGQMVTDYWTTGAGIGSYRFANRPYKTFAISQKSPKWFLYSENQYLESLIIGGIPGLTLLLMPIVLLARAVLALIRQGDRDSTAIGVLGAGALGSQAVAATFDFGLYLAANAALFALIAGIVFRAAQDLGSESANRRWPSQLGWALVFVCGFAALPCLFGETLISRELDSNRKPLTRKLGERRTVAEVDEQIGALRRSLRWVPDHTLGNLQLGLLYLEKNQLEVFESLRRSAPTKLDSELWLGSSIDFLHKRAHMLEREQGNRSQLRNDPVIQANLQNAWSAFQAANHSCPLYSKVHYRLAQTRILATSGDQNNEPTIDRMVRLAPQSARMRFRASAIAFDEGRVDLGLRLFTEFMQLSDELGREQVRYANLVLTSEQFANTLPNDKERLVKFVLSKEMAYATRTHRAAAVQKSVLVVNSTDAPEAQRAYDRFTLYQSIGDITAATKELAAAVEERPSEVSWRFRLAKNLLDQGDAKQALHHATLCSRQQPRNAVYRRFLDRIKRKQK